MIRIECNEPTVSSPCPDCGGVTTTLTRFVYEDEDALAIYYARFAEAHPEHPVKLAVGLGDWSEDAAPHERQSFALDLRVAESHYEIMVTDAAASPWNNARIIGRMLDRVEALAHPRIKEVFHITDHITTQDPVLVPFLEKQLATPNKPLNPTGAEPAPAG